jgi:hypothetical protein
VNERSLYEQFLLSFFLSSFLPSFLFNLLVGASMYIYIYIYIYTYIFFFPDSTEVLTQGRCSTTADFRSRANAAMWLDFYLSPFVLLVIFQIGSPIFAKGQPWTTILLPKPLMKVELQMYTTLPSLYVELWGLTNLLPRAGLEPQFSQPLLPECSHLFICC